MRNLSIRRMFNEDINTFLPLIQELMHHRLAAGCETSELNSYVNNYPSHKFYLNQGYEIWAHHFLKKL